MVTRVQPNTNIYVLNDKEFIYYLLDLFCALNSIYQVFCDWFIFWFCF